MVALNSAPCGQCFYCSKHQENLCEDLLFNNGAYAEYITIPKRIVERNMLTVPTDVSVSRRLRWSNRWLACCVGWKRRASVGDTVSVIGGGPIGLMFVQVAKPFG